MSELTLEALAKKIADEAKYDILDEEAFNESVYEALVNLISPHLYMVDKENKGIIKKKGENNVESQRSNKVTDEPKGANDSQGTRSKKRDPKSAKADQGTE